MSIGLNVGLNLASTKKVKDFIESDNKNSIRLMFPNLDFNFDHNSEKLREIWDSDIFEKPSYEIGTLAPHIILEDGLSLRQKMAKICLEEGKSYQFVVCSETPKIEPHQYHINHAPPDPYKKLVFRGDGILIKKE